MSSVPITMPESIYDYIRFSDNSDSIRVTVLVPVIVDVRVPKR